MTRKQQINAVEQVDALREKIVARQAERKALQAQARSRAEVVALVDEKVAEWGATGAKVATLALSCAAAGSTYSPLKVEGRAFDLGRATVDLGALMVALLGAQAVRAALLRGIDDVPVGLDRKAKAARLAAIERELDTLEAEEEALIEQSEAEGEPIQRRPNARPEIVLAPYETNSEGGDHD